MSEGASTPFTPKGGLTVDFAALLLLGRERGYLTPDDLMAVLEAVELTPALIDAVVGRVRAEGIEWREEGDATWDRVHLGAGGAQWRRRRPRLGPARPPCPPMGRPPMAAAGSWRSPSGASASLEPGCAAGPASPTCGSTSRAARGGSADPVRMYLKEIGKVPLLTGRRGGGAGPLRRAGAAGHRAPRGRGEESALDRPTGRLADDERTAPGRAHGQAHPGRGQPPSGGVDRQALPQPGHGLPGPDPGGQPRPDAGGRQVRLHQGLQVLHLCHLVDPPGHHPGHRRPGADHPHPGPHGRDDQQGGPGPAPVAAGLRARADGGGAGGAGRDDARSGCGRSSGSARRRCRWSSRWARTTSACRT